MKAVDGIIYGSFLLSGTEFAISAKYIQEVVNPPATYIPVPLAPSYLMGLFNLRGAIIPVIDLRKILELGESARGTESKIAIVENAGFPMGLLFDQTSEIFKAGDAEKCTFQSQDATAVPVIEGVFKRDGGQRLVQIINVDGLFALHKVPKQVATENDRNSRVQQSRRRGNRRQCISFLISNAVCALPIASIQEIIQLKKIETAALAVGNCIGAFDLRGATIPTIDLPALLGYRSPDKSAEATLKDRRIVVMRYKEHLVGMLVDGIESIVTYFEEDLVQLPTVTKERFDLISGCISKEGERDILLFNPEKILRNDEISEMTKGHSALFRAEFKNSAAQKTGVSKDGRQSDRKTYITFSVETKYAIAIEDVREIINFPDNLLTPPGLPPHIEGVLNLRGELITIVNARKMYSLAQSPLAHPKIMIFKNAKANFGLVVDSVESIVAFSAIDRMKLPTLLYESANNKMNEDILDAVYVEEAGVKMSYLIINVEAISARVAA